MTACTGVPELPDGAQFYRNCDGDVFMRWPHEDGQGVYLQALRGWIDENCPPGTGATIEAIRSADSPDLEIISVILEFPDLELAEVDPDARPAAPRVFHLVRYDDVSGVSGTGIVGQGMQARDGAVALRWCVPGMPAAWNLYESIDDLLLVAGHNGRTVVKWADEDQPLSGGNPCA